MRQSAIGKHPKDGALNPCWKGGRKIRQDGYILVRLYPKDEYYDLASKSGYAMEHRVIASKMLGRLVRPFPIEVVNHKNGVKDDNRPENLEVKSQSTHLQEHTWGYQDGYERGYLDGISDKIKTLEAEITSLKQELNEKRSLR